MRFPETRNKFFGGDLSYSDLEALMDGQTEEALEVQEKVELIKPDEWGALPSIDEVLADEPAFSSNEYFNFVVDGVLLEFWMVRADNGGPGCEAKYNVFMKVTDRNMGLLMAEHLKQKEYFNRKLAEDHAHTTHRLPTSKWITLEAQGYDLDDPDQWKFLVEKKMREEMKFWQRDPKGIIL